MRAIAVLTTTALLAISVASCTTVQHAEIRARCTPPPSPALPPIDRGELWDAVGDAEYRRVEAYINRLWAYADEQAAMLDALCTPEQE